MNESDPISSSTYSSELRNQLSTVRSIAHNDTDTTSVVHEYENKVNENLMLKETIINLQSQLKMSQEATKLQAAEYAFQGSEYEAEIRSLKKIESDLRDALLRASKDKNDNLHDVEFKFKQELDQHEREKDDYLQNIQAQVSRLRSTISDLQTRNEIFSEDLHRYKQENQDLSNQLSDQKEFYENKLLLLQNHLNMGETSMNEMSNAIRSSKQKYDGHVAELEAQLLSAQRTINDLQSEKDIFDDKEKNLLDQVQALMTSHSKMSEKIAAENSKNGLLKTENSHLQNKIDKLETELKTNQKILAQIKDNTKESRSVSFCSPLQRTRIDIYKIIEKYNISMSEIANQMYPEEGKGEIKIRSVILFVIFARRWLSHTRNENNICDSKGGLLIFKATIEMTPLQLLIRAKNELATSNCFAHDIHERTISTTNHITELSTENRRNRQMQEALALQLNSAKKCNNTLHRQLTSFIKFHDAVCDYESI